MGNATRAPFLLEIPFLLVSGSVSSIFVCQLNNQGLLLMGFIKQTKAIYKNYVSLMKALKLTEFVSKRNWNFTSQKKQLLDNARPYKKRSSKDEPKKNTQLGYLDDIYGENDLEHSFGDGPVRFFPSTSLQSSIMVDQINIHHDSRISWKNSVKFAKADKL
ncbi:hypothetical protein AB4K20DRAFT_1867900 [Rhizopus microsporus]|uniref:Uncharacterized protein n=1 Tax=Rhizopus microsporus TaxID=58291 RepID=A0A1X0RMF1_RHIZD|nr:hypothetical protein BCV71DRAFT_279043 [Rhizopus microsporus]